MYFMAIACLFAVPAYYLAKSKGRSGRGYSLWVMILGVPAMVYPIGIFLPALALGVLYLMPARPGAPGKTYLEIVFSCPECGQQVSFHRDREGAAELCPECGELIRVPEDEYSPPNEANERPRKPAIHGEVCFNSFGRPEPAHLLAAILNENGVMAYVASDSAGGVMPYIGNTEGHRVMINESQWEEATEIERQSRQGETGG